MARKPAGRGRKAVAKRKPSNRRKPVKRVKKNVPPLPPLALTVAEWCQVHRIGRTNFYKLLQQGRAPPTVMMGRRRIITHEGSAQWLREREREALETAAQQRKAIEAAPLVERSNATEAA
jgi:hypothetical protein